MQDARRKRLKQKRVNATVGRHCFDVTYKTYSLTTILYRSTCCSYLFSSLSLYVVISKELCGFVVRKSEAHVYSHWSSIFYIFD